MDKSGSRLPTRLLLFAIVAVGYFLISNFDTLDLPDNFQYVLRPISSVVSFVGGLLFFASIAPLCWLVVRLIRRKGMDREPYGFSS